jgi:hypothetical protein
VSKRLPPSQRPGRQPGPEDADPVLYLASLAFVVRDNDLSSPDFTWMIDGVQKDTGHEPPAAAREIVAKFKTAHQQGAHYTSKEVVEILRVFAGRIRRGEDLGGID